MPKRIVPMLCLAMSAVVAPPAFASVLDMSSFWPNDDGRSWTYQSRYEAFSPPEVVDQVVRLTLDGVAIAPAAIAVQVLREELVSGPIAMFASAPGVTSPLMRQLWEARPDLRDAIVRRSAASILGGSCPTDAPPGGYPGLLLSGQLAYRKTIDEIAAWRCNRADTRAWIWLVSDLTPGNTFTLQLVPDLASDVILRGTMGALEDVTVTAGTFGQCLRVDYVVDYGASECTDASGEPNGTFRSETRGFVHYAAGVGPVESFEAFIPYAEATGTCVDPGDVGVARSQISRQLASTPVPVVATSWGRLKTIYR